MRVFLSYSSSESWLAERLAYSLRHDGHAVFFDRASLPAGEDYDSRIRRAIQRCRLFIFLISADSVSPGSYALTELGFAQQRWDSPAGRVLPVMVGDMDPEKLPPYLGAVTVLRPQGDLVAEVVAAVGELRRRHRRRQTVRALLMLAAGLGLSGLLFRYGGDRLPRLPWTEAVEPVQVHGMVTNSGWILSFDIVSGDRALKEISYRLDDQAEFQSTGLQPNRNPRTGLPLPRTSVEIPGLRGRHTIYVKYTDSAGREHGPYAVPFDAEQQLVASTKETLESTPNSWIAFREYPAGRLLLYFTHLVSYKNALQEIRYSLDDESLSRRVRFKPDWSGPGAPGIRDDDEILVEIPMSTRYVAVQLVFIDGSEWPARKFMRTNHAMH